MAEPLLPKAALPQDLSQSPLDLSQSSLTDIFVENGSTLIILQICCFLLGTLAFISNAIVLKYYLPRSRVTYPLLLVFKSGCDCASGLSASLVGAVLVQLARSPDTFNNSGLVGAVYFLTGVTARVSVMYSLVLAVTRTINVSWLRYTVSYAGIVAALVGVMVFWTGFASIELFLTLRDCQQCPTELPTTNDSVPGWVNDREDLEELFVMPLMGKQIAAQILQVLHMEQSMAFEIFLLKVIPFILPSCLAVVCLAVTAYQLLHSPVGRRSRVSRRITTTVLYLTLVFAACNLPYFCVLLVLGHPDIKSATHATLVVRFVSATVAPFVSAVLLPGILIVRGHEIRDYVTNGVLRYSSPRGGKGDSSPACMRLGQSSVEDCKHSEEREKQAGRRVTAFTMNGKPNQQIVRGIPVVRRVTVG